MEHSEDLAQDGNVYTCSWTRAEDENEEVCGLLAQRRKMRRFVVHFRGIVE